MGPGGAGAGFQHLPGQMADAAIPGGADVQHPGRGQGEEFGQRPHREGGLDGEDLRAADAVDDRREVAQRIKAGAAIHRRVDGQRIPPGEQRVAVRRGAGDQVEGDVAARRALAFHHETLADDLRQVAGQQPCQRIDTAARGDRDDQPDRPGGPGLGRGRADQGGKAEGAEGAAARRGSGHRATLRPPAGRRPSPGSGA